MHTLVTDVAKYFIAIPVLVFLYVLWKQDRQERIHLLFFAIASTVIALIFTKVATTLHADPRPFVTDGVQAYFKSSTDNGFPSDHTVFSTVIAFAVFTVHRGAGVALLVVAAIIGAARVIAGVHHGQDVVGGILIAAAAYCITLVVTRKIFKNSPPIVTDK